MLPATVSARVLRVMSFRSEVPWVTTLAAVMDPKACTVMEPSLATRLVSTMSVVLARSILPAALSTMSALVTAVWALNSLAARP